MRPHPRIHTPAGVAPTGAEQGQSQNKRYSFVDTPMELQGPGYQNSAHRQSIPPLPTLPSTGTSPEVVRSAQSDYPADRKLEPQAGSPYNLPPPTEPHPAQFAPYAEDMSTDHLPTQQSEHELQAPYSPGPIPIKTDLESRDSPQQSGVTNIGPDANPLQSPRTPLAAKGRTFTPSYHPDSATGPDGMVHENHLPGQVSHPDQQLIGGTWKHGLCDCTDVGVCCTGIWCPCVLYGKTQFRLSQKSAKKDPTNMLAYETINGSCGIMAILCGCGWILAAIQHTRTRKMYEIEGGVGSDCVRALCCTCCTLMQDEREIKYREDHARKFAGPATGAAVAPYKAPGTMSYAPPPR